LIYQTYLRWSNWLLSEACDNRDFLQSYDNPRVSIGRKAAQNQRLFEKPLGRIKIPPAFEFPMLILGSWKQQVQDTETSF
jgi:hypothetical protein